MPPREEAGEAVMVEGENLGERGQTAIRGKIQAPPLSRIPG